MDAAGVALLSAGITSVAGTVGAFVTMYLAPGKRKVDEETRRKIIAETAEIVDRSEAGRMALLHKQLDELSELANRRYRRQLSLEQYIDEDMEWHREVVVRLNEAGVKVPVPPELPKPEAGCD